MSRRAQLPSLDRPPADPRRLLDFPRVDVGPDEDLWRVTRRSRNPWWFGSSMTGRFDLPKPDGTCYLATDVLSALLEVVGPDRLGGAVSADFFASRALHRLQLPAERSLADLTTRRAAGFGVTLEVHSMVPYDLPQAWASALWQAGAEGLRYWVRHDPAAGGGVALFGSGGEQKAWRRGRELPIGGQLTRQLERECGIAVVEIPRRSEVELVEPPVP
jgi:hypothetical protein